MEPINLHEERKRRGLMPSPRERRRRAAKQWRKDHWIAYRLSRLFNGDSLDAYLGTIKQDVHDHVHGHVRHDPDNPNLLLPPSSEANPAAIELILVELRNLSRRTKERHKKMQAVLAEAKASRRYT
jgi:hypothetical protein